MGLRLLHGLGSSGFIAGIFSLLSKSTSQRRAGATFSLTGIAIMTSMAIFPSIGEVLIARYGFSSLFITASILSLIPVLIVPFISKQNQPNTVRSLAQRPSYLVFLKEKRFLYLLLSTWIFSHSQATVFNFISLLLKEYKRLPSTFFFPSFSISILSLFILSKTLDSVKKSRLLKISYPIYSFSIFMIPLSIKMDISLLSTAMFGYGIASLFSIHNTLAATYGVMEHRHYSMSLFTAVYDLGFITGPIIGGLILKIFCENEILLSKIKERYAKFIFKELSLVPKWVTTNEPFSIVNNGYIKGDCAPGFKNMKQAIQVMHNLLISHGKAVKAYKEMDLDGEIGIELNLTPIYPHRKEDECVVEIADDFRNKWFLNPIMKGEYPSNLLKIFQEKWNAPTIKKNDLDIMSTPIDFLGINYYSRYLIEIDKNNILGFKRINPKDCEYTSMGWEIYHKGLYDILLRLKKEFKKIPIYITESGAAFSDKLEKDRVHDKKRIKYLSEEIKKAYEALKCGVNLKGYYIWSLMDNFEWSFGYSKRFGLIYIDYKTQQRIWKDSAYFYKNVIKNNGII